MHCTEKHKSRLSYKERNILGEKMQHHKNGSPPQINPEIECDPSKNSNSIFLETRKIGFKVKK